jgi:CO dehydrogenase maturation factor
MGKSIAICGKGGVGKTVFTVLLTKALVRNHGRLLVIDADPVVGLPQALGVSVTKTIGNVAEEIIAAAQSSDDKPKIEVVSMLDYMVLEALIELDGFSLLTMGKRESPGCFCPVNQILRDAIEALSRSFDVILIDGEAGVEQVNRKVTDKVDILLTVTDPTIRGLQTAALIDKVAHVRESKKAMMTGLVISRVREGYENKLRQTAQKMGLEVVGLITEDENITKCDMAGKPIYNIQDHSPSIADVREIAKKLELLS